MVDDQNVKMLCMDVDGTLTDGAIHIGESGELYKSFYCRDGLGILMLQDYGITPVIITARESKIVWQRAQELNIIHVYQGIKEKHLLLPQIAEKMSVPLDEVAYIGDDINDLECMKLCGLTGCPADSVEKIKQMVDYICVNEGGRGAVREFIERILLNKKRINN